MGRAGIWRLGGRCWLVGALLGPALVVGESVRQRPAFGSDRYAKAVFVCRSVDPSGSALNLREKPAGRILGILSPQSVLYVRGRDLQNPVRGYVPIRFYLELAAVDPRQGAENSVSSAPAGWVWKSYITCELSS
ncbi:MAG: hypothetical protein VKO39_10265 [Cyanobacteriota bacterium]|nr:hypothetical protein [Cyanobacteriota bacterium]